MEMKIFVDKAEMGKVVAKKAAEILKEAIKLRGKASFICATGAAQFDFLEALTKEKGIDWKKTAMFHLDEYIGIGENHPASFRKYLRERFITKVKPGEVNLIDGDSVRVEYESDRLSKIISQYKIDVAFVGVGENCHLAFNDPPADFRTDKPFIVVELNDRCKQQQVNEGWFKTKEEVPQKAITMTITQIMKSQNILCLVPEKRKAEAVKNCLEGDICSEHPASILRMHPNVYFYLDKESSSLLNKKK
ncbi:MAG TPA: glucosamine-6-phosphate deaminase [Elusimicrobia bacterium]|nr:glucosamine-6-phosphate deaminase [Elusimicrobiota bacterium]